MLGDGSLTTTVGGGRTEVAGGIEAAGIETAGCGSGAAAGTTTAGAADAPGGLTTIGTTIGAWPCE